MTRFGVRIAYQSRKHRSMDGTLVSLTVSEGKIFPLSPPPELSSKIIIGTPFDVTLKAKQTGELTVIASKALGFVVALSLNSIMSMQALAQTGVTGVHGLALGAPLKYGPDLKFEWLNPNAPKGGKLSMHNLGSFDSLNPHAVKNDADYYLKFLVFEPLVHESMGEPFAMYGAVAKSMDVPADGMSITYHLNPAAKFSDGKPVTATDVEFSFKILTSDKAPPETRLYYSDVKQAVIMDPHTIRFDFKVKNHELPLIMGQLLYVLPKHVYGVPGKDFVKQFANVKPIGTGPYTVKSFDFGKQITYERNKNWWAVNEPHGRGAYNFDLIEFKYYKDRAAAMEGFKAGDFDVEVEYTSRAWVVDHSGEKWDKNWIRKETWDHHKNQGEQGIAMNLRRPLFQDRKLRKALAIAFDFEWANETLFYKQYTAGSSFFNNSEFDAKGLPDAKELALLNPLKDKLPIEVFTEEKRALGQGLTGKQRLGEALKLLKDAGWELKDGIMHNKKGEKLEMTVLVSDPVSQRVLDPYAQSLAKIGVKLNVKMEDSANYIKRVEKFDFDLISVSMAESESPGNEQRDFWHSTSANLPESRNYAGVKDPAIDALIDAVIKANSRDELVTATRALDRALWFSYIHIPEWYSKTNRVSYWNRISVPDIRPPYYTAEWMFFQYGWYDAAKAAKLDAAMKSGTKLQ